jgi:DNA primase
MAKQKKIKSSEFQRVAETVDIVKVIGKEIPLKRKGAAYTGCCPFHKEDTPSFIVNPKDAHSGAPNRYHCFGGQCSEHGDVINFVQKYFNLSSAVEALEYISENYNIPLEYEEYSLSPEEQRYKYLMGLNSLIVDFLNQNLINQPDSSDIKKYLYDRGITDDDIKLWKIGYGSDNELSKNFIGKNCLNNIVQYKDFIDIDIVKDNFFTNKVIIPIFDNRGNPIAFSNRIFAYNINKDIQSELEKKLIEGHEKYKNTGIRQTGYNNEEYGSLLFKSKAANLYGLNYAKQHLRKNDWTLILVEGYFDVQSCHRNGIYNVAGLMGTAFNEDTIKLLKSCNVKRVVFCLDGDKGGIGGVAKILENIQEQRYKEEITFSVGIGMLPTGYDPDEYFRCGGTKETFALIIDNCKCISEFLIDREIEKTELNTLSQKINFINEVKKDLDTKRVLSSLEKKLIVESLSEKLSVSKDIIMESIKVAEEKNIDSLVSEKSEKIVIAELIYSDESRMTILSSISMENYFYNRNKRLHELIVKLQSEQQPIDFDIIEIKSKEMGFLGKDFDLDYLSIIKDIPRINVDYHVKKVLEYSTKRKLLNISQNVSNAVYESEDMQQVIGSFGNDLYKLNFSKNEDIFKNPQQEALDYFNVMAKRFANPGKNYGILTGYKILDESTQGFFPGQSILILARTSDGKTALGQNFGRNIALNQTPGSPIYYANLEMPSQDMMDRIMSIDSSVPIRKVCSGEVNEKQRNKILSTINNYGKRGTFHIQYTTDLTVSKLASILRYQIEVNKIKLAVVDYVQLMAPEKEYLHAARSEQLAMISRGLTGLAKTLNIPIIIIAQANRTTVTDNAGRPELHHVFGTDQLAHDVDVAMSLQPKTKAQMEKQGGFLSPEEMCYLGYGHLLTDKQGNLMPDNYERYKIGRNGNYVLHILKNRKGQKDFSYPIFFHKFKIKFQECEECMQEIQLAMSSTN